MNKTRKKAMAEGGKRKVIGCVGKAMCAWTVMASSHPNKERPQLVRRRVSSARRVSLQRPPHALVGANCHTNDGVGEVHEVVGCTIA